MSAADEPLSTTLEAWVLASLPRAVAFARSLVGDPTVAEDLVQECYCKLLRKASEYDLPRDGTRLLFTTLTRVCIDRHRRPRGDSLDQLMDGQPDYQHSLADPHSPNPEQVARHRELESALEQALLDLPVQQRAALELKGFGYSQREIALALGTNENHVGVLIYRARQTLAVRLQPYRDEVAQ